ncbi:MAG: hypothetical protein IJR83_06480 [Clostridia bacterium]|nr:hypothetical protein [Clostridia bacterium]
MSLKKDLFAGVKKTLVFSRDCTEPLREGVDFWIGQTCVKDTPLGKYRETDPADNSRFGFRFDTPYPKLPHLLEVDYPDDRPRVICVQDGVSYDLTSGLSTGGDMVCTGRMRTLQEVFWPRAADLSVLICTVSGEEPAAAAAIRVYALSELPAAQKEPTAGRRTFGIQYEDPCGTGASEGAMEFYTWLEHHIQFMKLTGQNRLVYPVNWYHGPIVPVGTQPHSRFNSVVAPDRRSYGRSKMEAPDWLTPLLERFDKEGFVFSGSLTLLRLGRLMERMNTDAKAVAEGAETINNVLYNGQIQGSCNDWTYPYHPANFPEIARRGEATRDMDLIYGEKCTSDMVSPIFNCLHPQVQSQIVDYFVDLAERYASHPSFTGLSVNFWHGTLLWFGHLLCGYDDYTVSLFAKEKGHEELAHIAGPDRFNRRYRYIMEHLKEEWIGWRCAKVRELVCRIRDGMRSVRRDLVLTLNVWNEPSRFAYYHGREGFPGREEWDKQLFARPSNYEMYRWGGLDLEHFTDEKGISVSVERGFFRDVEERNGRPVWSRCLTDPMWLDQKLLDVLDRTENSAGFHFDCWVERWGESRSYELDESDRENERLIRQLPDFTPDYIWRSNCIYRDEIQRPFFYRAGQRITSVLPPDWNILEHMTADLARHDALNVTAGGLYLDKSHTEQQRAFAKAYEKLPAVKFSHTEARDPVTLRWHTDGKRGWVYLVNLEPYRIPVTFTVNGEERRIRLAPFELRTFVFSFRLRKVGCRISVPAKTVKGYEKDTARALEALDRRNAARVVWQRAIPELEQRIRKASGTGAYATLRHLLQSYFVRLALEEDGVESKLQ